MGIKTKTVVKIRVDADHEIGIGHFVRCLALGEMLIGSFEIEFCYQTMPVKIIELHSVDFRFSQISSDQQFFSNITSGELVVIDSYTFPNAIRQKIAERGNVLVEINDIPDPFSIADLIINANPAITPRDYRTSPFTRLALGLDYVLLRTIFLKGKPSEGHDLNAQVVICFGGADPKNLTESVTDIILASNKKYRITLIIGISNPHRMDIDRKYSPFDRVSIVYNATALQMAELLSNSVVAIVPASGILYEALYMGCKVISGYYADNQKLLYHSFREEGLIYDAQDFQGDPLRRALEMALKSPKSELVNIDGKSGDRIRRLFLSLEKQVSIVFNKARKEDETVTGNWAADPAIRRFSLNPNPIKMVDHIEWFNSKIQDPLCYYYIGLCNGKPIGSVRFDISKQEAILSYLLAPQWHGRGFGLPLLVNGIRRFYLDNHGQKIKQIRALVKAENKASFRIFEHLNFTLVDSSEILTYVKSIEYENRDV